MTATPAPQLASARLAVDYADRSDLDTVLADDDTLAVFGFGEAAPSQPDPRYLRVPLQPHGAAPLEVWRSTAPVQRGRDGDIAWAHNDALQFGAIELDECDGDIESAARDAYGQLLDFVVQRGYPHLLRIWNYLDAITEGADDDERYRRFCIGRAAGLGDFDSARLPAATAIGLRDGRRRLQVYWLASRTPGTPLENPRQVSAYRYPRQYGPQSPSFARAMLPPSASTMPLLLSGTASVVGHETRHAERLEAQLDETFANLDSLVASARRLQPALPAQLGSGSRLKVYVRDADAMPQVQELLDARLGADVPRIVLHAGICRRDLQVEIDGVHAAP